MKKWKKVLAFVLCLVMVYAVLPSGGAVAAKAAEKSGLQLEGGKYYFYSDGKRIKNKWKNLRQTTGSGKVKYRYYFGGDGVAYKGKVSGGILIPAVRKIGGKSYGFDEQGHMLTGVYVKNGQFYVFSSGTGVLDTAATQKLRKASKEGASFAALVRLLKKQGAAVSKKQSGLASCYGDGTDLIYSYAGFDVQGFKDRKTKAETVVSVVSTATRADKPETAAGGEAEEEDSTDEVENPVTQTGKGLQKIKGKYYYFDKKGVKLRNKWKTINGNRYYFKANGRAQTGTAKIDGKLYLFDLKGRLAKGTKDHFKKVGEKRYYVNAKGQPYTGWKMIGGALYYADSKGVLKRNTTTAEGIMFDNNGKAKSNTASNLKIKTMQIVAGITNGRMSGGQKLQACWNYVTGGGRFSYYTRMPSLGSKGWQRQEALNMLQRRAGNCYGFACAFAALASEVGYTPYVVAGRVTSNGYSRDNAGDGMTPHCWVRINGRYYDPEAQFKGWWTGVYGLASYDIGHRVQYTVKF